MEAAQIQAALEGMWASFNKKDLDGFVGNLAENATVWDNTGLSLNSRAEFRSYVSGLFNFSTDSKVTIPRTIISGDHAAAELHMEATHDGEPIYGAQPSGKRVEITWTIHVDIVNGKVQHLRIFSDAGSFLAQLGVGTGLPEAWHNPGG